MLRVHLPEQAQGLQCRRRALNIVVVNHNFSKYFAGIKPLKEMPATGLFTCRISKDMKSFITIALVLNEAYIDAN